MKILFVCLGNICRSPAAESIMVQKLKVARTAAGEQVTCDSAGTSGYHEGEEADPRMQVALKERGYLPQSRSRQIRKSDFAEFDLILAMDSQNLKTLKTQCPGADELEKIHLMSTFCRKYNRHIDVPDPYFGGPSGFIEVIDLLEDACGGLLDAIIRDHPEKPNPKVFCKI